MPGLSSLQVNIKDQPHNLAWINEAEQALLKDLGGSGRPGPMGIPAYFSEGSDDNDEGEGEGEAGDGTSGDSGGGSGGSGEGDGEDDFDTDRDEDFDFDQGPAGAAAAADSMDPDALSTDTPGLSAAEAGAAAAAADALGAEATQSEQQAAIDTATVDFAMENNPDLYGYNDLVDMGYFDTRDVAMSASDRQNARSHEAEMKSRGYNVSVTIDKDGTYSYTGPDAAMAAASSIADAARTAADYMGVYGFLNQISRAAGPYNKETERSDRDFAESLAAFNTLNAERSAPDLVSMDIDELSTDNPSIGSQSDRGDLDAMDREDVQDLFGFDPTTDVYNYNEPEVLDLTRREETEQAPKVQASVAPTPTPTPASPKSNAVPAYFARLGISPTAPSSSPAAFQQQTSYLPPTGPAANAAYRRGLALATPIYNEPSRQAGEPFNYSAATLAATYGIPYEIALDKLRSQNATAMGGGGLRSLMEYS